jgi:2'-5' RNA ligase
MSEKTTMRLFTGIALDPAVMNNLEQVLRELGILAPFKWSPVENLHITSKFIGAWPEARLTELKQVLSEIHVPQKFSMTIEGFGYFPNAQSPRVLFAGVKARAELAQLAREIDEKLVPLGVAREERPYAPHVTLARIKSEPLRAVREHIANMKNFDFGTYLVSEFHLYLSTPEPGGSVYRILATFPFGSQA